MRQAAGDRTQHGHPSARKVQGTARSDGGHHRGQRPGYPAADPAQPEHQDDHARRDRRRRGTRLGQAGRQLDHLVRQGGPGCAHPEHVAELAGRHLDAHPREEPHQHRAGEEVGEEAEPSQPGQQQKRGDQQRGRPCQLDVARRRGDGQARQPGGQDRGGRRVGPHDKVTRGPEQREDHYRHQQRVEAGLHRHPGDPGVAEHLGDGETGQRDTGDHVGQQLGAPQREKARRSQWPTPPTPVQPRATELADRRHSSGGTVRANRCAGTTGTG